MYFITAQPETIWSLIIVDTKKCSKCQEIKGRFEFNKAASSSDGLQNNCRVCHGLYNRAWQQKHKEHRAEQDKIWKANNPEKASLYRKKVKDKYRKEWRDFIEERLDLECSHCGYDKCFAALDFHHTGDKSFAISGMMQKKPSKENRTLMRIELIKTIILCSNCHRELHQDERDTGDYLEPAQRGY